MCWGKWKAFLYQQHAPTPSQLQWQEFLHIFSVEAIFMLSRVCQMKVTHAHSFIFIFFFFLLPLLGLPNKLMPFYLFFTNTLRAEQSRTQNSVRSWKSRRLECCHPILRVAQVLERKKLYFIKQTKANFYNFLFNANKSKVAATGWEARGERQSEQKSASKKKKGKSPRKAVGKHEKKGFAFFFSARGWVEIFSQNSISIRGPWPNHLHSHLLLQSTNQRLVAATRRHECRKVKGCGNYFNKRCGRLTKS